MEEAQAALLHKQNPVCCLYRLVCCLGCALCRTAQCCFWAEEIVHAKHAKHALASNDSGNGGIAIKVSHVAQVLRGGWGGPKPGYTLSYQTAASDGSHVEQVPFSGLDDELTAFADQVLVSFQVYTCLWRYC